MFNNIEFDKDLEPDERIIKEIARGIALAKEQGYDVEDMKVFVKKPSKTLPFGAGAKILDLDRCIAVAVDKHNPNVSYISQLIVHEINHLEREQHSSIQTLEEVLVSEGLAQMAEKKAGFDLIPISKFSSDEDRKTAIVSMSQDFNQLVFSNKNGKNYDHYFGDQSELPNHSGYALGFEMVSSYMEGTGLSIQQATQKSASEIANYWKNTL